MNHFGIVSGLCKELQLAENIDRLIIPDPQQRVTTGQAVVSMVLNGLGFSNRTLYLFPQFLENKPVNLLISPELEARDFSDDTLGRTLDRLYHYGCTELFCQLAAEVTAIADIDKKFAHLDTTTFSVHGEYQSSEDEDAAIHITHGHAKQNRFDLKQIFLNLLVASDGGVPLFMQALDGNSADPTTFRRTITEFRRGLKYNLQEITYWIADSAFYNEQTLHEVGSEVCWISHVPETIKEVQSLLDETALYLCKMEANAEGEKVIGIQKPTPSLSFQLKEEGYSYNTHVSSYGGVQQRWLVIFSLPGHQKAVHSIQKSVDKEFELFSKFKAKVEKQAFETTAAATSAVEAFQLKAKFHTCSLNKLLVEKKFKRRGRPAKTTPQDSVLVFHPRISIEKNQASIAYETYRRSVFILATNELSENNLSNQDFFTRYKDQQKVERGFRFLKDPLFFASALFLKKPERIVSLTMIMCLSLLVYTIGERKLRNILDQTHETLLNQVKKPTNRPTLRWIFQIFEDVHVIKIATPEEITYETKNLRIDAIKALKLLGKDYMKTYLLTY